MKRRFVPAGKRYFIPAGELLTRGVILPGGNSWVARVARYLLIAVWSFRCGWKLESARKSPRGRK